MIEYTNSQIRAVIDEYCHNADDRKMLCMRFVDGLTFERIAFEMGMTTKTVRIRIHKYDHIILRYLPG